MTKKKNFSPEQKVTIIKKQLLEIKKQLLEKVPVSDLCDQYGFHPSLFYRWQKMFFEKGYLVFQKNTDSGTTKLEKKVSALENKLVKKNEVLSELMEEHVALKKNFGEI